MAQKYGAEHAVAAETIGDALRIVDCNHPDFYQTIRRRHFHVAMGEGRLAYESKTGSVYRGQSHAKEVQLHQLPVPRKNGDWHLVPAMTGAKQGGFKTIFNIILGGALLFTGVGGALGGMFGAGGAATWATGVGFMGLSYGTVALMGAGLFLGGLSMLLAPTPQVSTEDKKPTSFTFDGPGEIDDEGGPIPIILGEVVTGPVRISASIETASNAISRSGGGSATKWNAGSSSFDYSTQLV